MSQKTVNVVIDQWTEAVERLAAHAPPEVVEQLHEATADLIEAFSTASQNQASQYAHLLHNKVDALQVGQNADHQLLEALDARTDRRKVQRDA